MVLTGNLYGGKDISEMQIRVPSHCFLNIDVSPILHSQRPAYLIFIGAWLETSVTPCRCRELPGSGRNLPHLLPLSGQIS